MAVRPDRLPIGALRGLRARLTIAIALILVAALAVTFAATYQGTGAQVRRQIDQDLRQDSAALDRQGIPARPSGPAEVSRAARAYVQAQPFGASARLFIVRVTGGGTVTNEPELLGLTGEPPSAEDPPDKRARESAEARALRSAGVGFSTVFLEDAGQLRLLVSPVQRQGRQVADIAIGEPLAAQRRAQDSVARTFLLAGTLTLLAAVALGYVVATRTSRPLRQMARTAAVVDAGDVSHRMKATGPRDEIRVLADAFDHMLDRLADAFARQRSFVADASHDLRTPLTVIRGQLEVLARQPDVSPRDVRRVEEMVRIEVVRMERLVDDLLLLARADEGELVRPEPLELEPFVTELFDGLTMTAERRFELSSVPHGVLRADPDRIAQVVRNLVRNAVEHTGPGGVVRLAVQARGDRVEMAVEDDGPGIPADQRGRVFDRFHRTDSARARATGGAGLGLAIARAIVEAHGGRISAGASAVGGARVAFELPGFSPSPRRVPAGR